MLTPIIQVTTMWFDFDAHTISTILMQVDPKYLQTDILANIQVAFQNFLSSGQAGAMTIGIVSGYMVRGITR